MKLKFLTSLIAFLTIFSAHAETRTAWAQGHGDMGIAYSNGSFDWTLFEGDPPQHIRIIMDHQAQLAIPDLPTFNFLGEPGAPLWILPQTDSGGAPFLGIKTDVSNGVFVGNRLNLFLSDMAGPGDFLIWTTQSASEVNVFVNTRNGISEEDRVSAPAPGHFHQNWGFTAPGTYLLGFKAEATLNASGELVHSESGSIYEFQANVLDQGEVDLEVIYENGEWELALLYEGESEMEFEPGEAALHAGPATWWRVPRDPAFDFLGQPGDSVFILPQSEQEGVLFLGIAGDEIAPGVFSNDQVELELVDVDGPGHVFLYSTDVFGQPTIHFNSSDGISSTDAFPIAVGDHSHQNWGFSEPGYYKVGLRAKGTLSTTNEPTMSDVATFFFEVFEPTFFSKGEVDLEVAYEDGEWELVFLDEVTGMETALEEVVLTALEAAETTVPAEETFDFMHPEGRPLWVLPQQENPDLLFLGVAGDEIESEVFRDDQVHLNLVDVRGPGDVFFYNVDTFGNPTVFFNSHDGVSESDRFPVPVGGHMHNNWAFTAPGIYELDIQANGVLAVGGMMSASETMTLTFEIFGTLPDTLPEPEIDIEVGYEDGEWEIALLDALTLEEFEPEAFEMDVNLAAETRIPEDSAFSFLGTAGELFYLIPQNRNTDVLFLGVAGDEIPSGTFENNIVTLNFMAIEGPGDLFIYETDAFGVPDVLVNSRDGLGSNDSYPVPVGGHGHANWGFSKRGNYRVAVQASGILAESGLLSRSPVVVLSFAVAPWMPFSEGELDLEVAYEDGEWELVLLDEANERELEPDTALLQANPSTRRLVSEDPAFSFLGSPGSEVWVLPQDEMDGVLFLGIAGDEIPPDVFENDRVDLHMVDVRGAGDVSLYAVDAFGVPTVFFNSADGIDENDVFPVSVGGHSHQNWGFTAPGIYKVSLQASGVLIGTGSVSTSPVVEFTFEILPMSLRLVIVQSDIATLTLSWETDEDATYQLQAKNNLAQGEWMDDGEPVLGTGNEISVDVSIEPGLPMRFYRVIQIPSTVSN